MFLKRKTINNKDKRIKDKKVKEKGKIAGFISSMGSRFKGKIKLPTGCEPKQLAKEISLMGVVIYFSLEMLSNRSVLEGITAPFVNPLMFLCNTGLITMSLSIGLLLPKRHIGYMLASVGWLWLGFVNFILLGSRTTPLTAMDFKMLTSVFTVIGRYLSGFSMVMFAIGMIFLIIGIVAVCIKLPRTKWVPIKGMISIALCYTLMTVSFQLALFTGDVSRNFGNIANAYLDYGFAYSFTTSVIDRGIQRPATYANAIDDLIASMNKEEQPGDEFSVYAKEPAWIKEALFETVEDYQKENQGNIKTPMTGNEAESDTEEPGLIPESETNEEPIQEEKQYQNIPNIVMVQLETFFDVKRLKKYNFSQNPIPNFTRLSEEFSSGYVTVPSFGAGTANTEFEILTGMSLDYFGAGEYPYKTVLAKNTVESYAYDLSELGYHTHAIHNNMGTFYARHSVYPRLGFDGFTSIEYMDDVTYNELGWAKDENLIPEIVKVLDHTDTADFVFTVSVQAHGKYPNYPLLERPFIQLTPFVSGDGTAGDKPGKTLSGLDYQYLYYVNQLYEVDKFVGDLVKELEAYPEPVVVVFYGDHLPTFELDGEDLKEGSAFQTEYLIWDNMGLEEEDEDLMAYQLGAHVMNLFGYDNGIINKFHQAKMGTAQYETELEMIQYDLLYGEKKSYNGTNPYKKKKVSRGTDKAYISQLDYQGEALFIRGEYFTRWSVVYMDDEPLETIYVDSETLLVQMSTLDKNAKFKVSQITDTGRKLSSTKTFSLAKSNKADGPDVLDIVEEQIKNKVLTPME